VSVEGEAALASRAASRSAASRKAARRAARLGAAGSAGFESFLEGFLGAAFLVTSPVRFLASAFVADDNFLGIVLGFTSYRVMRVET
jgi:hypothetical protein